VRAHAAIAAVTTALVAVITGSSAVGASPLEPLPPGHTVTIAVDVVGEPLPGMSKITEVIECPARSGDISNTRVVDFDAHTGAPLVPGSEVVELTDTSCQVAQIWLSNPDWKVVAACESVPADWACTPSGEVEPGVVPFVDIDATSEGNAAVRFTNTFGSAAPAPDTDETADTDAAEAVVATPRFTG
jgi:hypothetical protein